MGHARERQSRGVGGSGCGRCDAVSFQALRNFEGSDERGTALVGVLLLLMLMTALASALAVSGRTETLVARNHQSAAQARLVAEAGLNHVAQVTIAWLRQWPNSYADVDAALDDLLANHSTLLDPDITFGTTIALSGTNNASYEVYLVDEDDSSRAGGAQTLEDDVDTGNDENNDPDDDENRHLVLRAIGTAQDETRAELEAVISPYELPAIVTNGSLTITGNTSIVAGANGGVHANGNLTLSGTSLVVVGTPDLADGSVTSSGTYSGSGAPVITGASGGGVAPKELPEVDADAYRSWADYILTSDGRITNASGTTTYCDTNGGKQQTACRNTYGWRFNGAWDLDYANPSAGEGTYFAEGTGTVSISASPGSALDPHAITLISQGSINITGSPHIAPASA